MCKDIERSIITPKARAKAFEKTLGQLMAFATLILSDFIRALAASMRNEGFKKVRFSLKKMT